MARVTSNAAAVVAEFAGFAGGIGFGMPGRYKSTLAEDVRDAVAQAEIDQAVNAQATPQGARFAPLAESTREMKARKGQPDIALVATGAMLSAEQLRGEAEVTRDSVEITYGTDEENRQKAEWAEKGSRGRNRPPRPFVGMSDRMRAALDDLIEEAMDRYVSGQ